MIVVLAADDNYAKYAAVAIASMIENHKGGAAVQFYVLNRNITDEHQRMLASMSDMRHTVSCIDVRGQLDSRVLYISGTITEETYYRVLIPTLFPEEDQALYVDCDVICNEDIEDFWQAASMTEDQWIAGTLAADLAAKNDYTTEHLGISSDTYVYAGLLMMNLKVLREIDFLDRCIAFLKEKQWLRQHDMDLINAVCYGHIKVLESRLHITVGAIAKQVGKTVETLTMQDLNVFFIHYATHKPWKTEMITAMLPYWHYVDQTPFAEEIVAAYREISDTKAHFLQQCSNNQISLGYLWRCVTTSIGARVHRR